MSRPAWSERPLWLPLRWLFVLVRALAGPPARALRGGARVVGDPARQMVDYWLSERATLRQGFAANTISAFTSLLAGIVLINMQGRMESIPGLLILIPVSIGMRGDILGAMAARLGTLVHTGLFEVSRDRNGPLYQNVYAASLLTIVTAVIMGLLARAIAALVGLETVSAWDLVVVAVVGGVLSSAVLLALAVPIAI